MKSVWRTISEKILYADLIFGSVHLIGYLNTIKEHVKLFEPMLINIHELSPPHFMTSQPAVQLFLQLFKTK